ncbi:MAG: glycosyltransferase [Chloroflexi bacterium]|nr:glycosyltransferase [Chloroflexota bacterium]
MAPFTVSVIVPVYNGSRTIRDCLEALLAQDYPQDHYEIIVVDNNSSDATPRLVSAYSRVTLLHQREVQSSYASRNQGARCARGEILAFTDADCQPAPDWISQLVKPFSDPHILAVGGMVKDSPPSNLVEAFLGEVSSLGNYHQAPGQFLRPLLTANAAFRKTAFDSAGGFNENLYTGADIDLAWRLQLDHPDCVCYSTAAVVFHHHRSNLKSMFRQYRRHGFGEVFLDAMYQQHAGYPRTLRYQVRQIGKQGIALLTYLRSFLFRLVRSLWRRDRKYLAQPLLWFVAESGNLWGKLQGLWVTRGLKVNPALRQWQDPGG